MYHEGPRDRDGNVLYNSSELSDEEMEMEQSQSERESDAGGSKIKVALRCITAGKRRWRSQLCSRFS